MAPKEPSAAGEHNSRALQVVHKPVYGTGSHSWPSMLQRVFGASKITSKVLDDHACKPIVNMLLVVQPTKAIVIWQQRAEACFAWHRVVTTSFLGGSFSHAA